MNKILGSNETSKAGCCISGLISKIDQSWPNRQGARIARSRNLRIAPNRAEGVENTEFAVSNSLSCEAVNRAGRHFLFRPGFFEKIKQDSPLHLFSDLITFAEVTTGHGNVAVQSRSVTVLSAKSPNRLSVKAHRGTAWPNR